MDNSSVTSWCRSSVMSSLGATSACCRFLQMTGYSGEEVLGHNWCAACCRLMLSWGTETHYELTPILSSHQSGGMPACLSLARMSFTESYQS